MNNTDIVIGQKVKSKIMSGDWKITDIKGRFITTKKIPTGQAVETRDDLFIQEWELANACIS